MHKDWLKNMNVLLDTNVLIDYYSKRQPFFYDALRLRIAAFFGDVTLWVTTQSLADAEYILRTSYTSQEVRSVMNQSLDYFHVCGVAAQDAIQGLASDWPDLEDFFIAQAASKIKADYVITRDSTGFNQCPIPVCTPSQFLDVLEQKGLVYEEVDLGL